VNPLIQTGRGSEGSGLSRLVSRVSIVVVIGAVILSWLLVKPGKTDNSGFWIMGLWFVILAIALGVLLMVWRSPARGSRDYLNNLPGNTVTIMLLAVLIVILGMVTAFLSGDKFDTIRAAALSGVLMIVNYPRRGHWRRA
jgi:peptidoglycan/LPS O-acetylase OafA/YrhL